MSDILKASFQLKNPPSFEKKPEVKDQDKNYQELMQDLRKKALGSLGGSMVYVERTDMIWDGDKPNE